MTSRQRLRKALEHQEPDRVPVDFGSTAVTGIHVTCVENLRQHFGLEKRPVKVWEPYQMLGWLEEDLRAAMGLDAEGLYPRNTLFGFPNEHWREFRTPWGQEVLVSEHFKTTVDGNGDLLLYPQGDLEALPRGRLPVGGFFFDTIVYQEKFEEEHLNPDDNLEEFTPIDEQALRHLRAEVGRTAASPRARVGTFGGTAFGDIALVPAPFLKRPKGIRDITEWYISTLVRQDYLHAVFSCQCELALANLEKIHAAVGEAIDVLFVCGTDFGTQTSSFCSPETFDSLYAPYYRQVNDWVHRHTSWKTFKHSCGAVEPFLSHFIDAGFDVVNPVQCSAAGMEPEKLKERYGDRLVFWGGGVDTQRTLPFGTPGEVRAQVLERCRIFSRQGGFVFNAVHNIQANTPVENIAAMFAAVREFNGEN